MEWERLLVIVVILGITFKGGRDGEVRLGIPAVSCIKESRERYFSDRTA